MLFGKIVQGHVQVPISEPLSPVDETTEHDEQQGAEPFDINIPLPDSHYLKPFNIKAFVISFIQDLLICKLTRFLNSPSILV